MNTLTKSLKRTRIKLSKRARSNRRMVKELDAACRQEVVIERDQDTCQRCGAKNGEWDLALNRPVVIQWAHVHTREYYVTRWEPDNSLALCDCCHVWFDNHKVLSYEWFRKTWPERWENIQNVLQSGAKVRVKDLYEELRNG